MKPPAWRLDRALYPDVFQMQPRYRDEDMLRHVNNIAVAAYYDEARARFMRRVFMAAEKQAPGEVSGVRIVTADSRVSYMGEVFYPDLVDIGTGILKLGTASITLGQAMFQNGRCVGLCDTVFVQASAQGAEPVHPVLRAVMGDLAIVEP